LKSGRLSEDSRFELVLEVFGVDKAGYTTGLNDFVRDLSHSPGFRSAIVYLAIKGRYPDSKQIQNLIALLQNAKFDEAVAGIRRRSSYRDSRRLLVPAPGNLVDVTRYSRTAEMSGIPRVVKSFATSNPVKGSDFGVWSDQVFGPVQITKEGFVYFNRRVWGNARNAHQFYFLIRKLFFSKSPKLAKMKFLGLFLKALRRLLFGRLLLKMVDIHAPKACYIINPINFIIPEVPDGANSELLRIWIENTSLQKVRCIVHDLLPLTHPEYFPRHAFGEHEEYVKLLSACTTLIVGTPILASELAEKLELPEANSRIKVLPLPVNLKSHGSVAANENLPLLTFVGGYQARKGLKGLVDYLESFKGSEIKFNVAVVGAPNLLSGHDEGRLYSRLLKQPDIYRMQDSLSDSDFADLIKSSAAVLYVSTAEGYGLPVLEALSLGVPVIATKTPVNEHFSERYGGIHLLETPYSSEDLIALNEIAQRGPLWQTLRASIKAETLPLDVETWARDLLAI